MAAERALSGLRVLDISENVSGPYCARLLSDCGADVIKVERPPAGDPGRLAGPFPHDRPDPEQSGLFLCLNGGKKGITLNLESGRGAELLRELAGQADILVENFKPGTMADLGLDYGTLQGVNPALIMVSISWFGQSGPYRDWNGGDMVAQATGGLMWLTGEPEREPLMLPLEQAQYQAGLNAAVAAMCALYSRDEGGGGQHIDVSIQQAVASILEGASTTYSYSGYVMRRAGSRHQQKCPSRVMRARDGFIHIQSGACWDHFSTFLEAPQLMQPRLASILRYRHADEVEAAIRPFIEGHTAGEILEAGQQWRIPVAALLGIDQVVHDPQHEARGYFQQVEHPRAGRLNYPGPPFRMGATPFEIGRAPLLGEHNEEVYGDMLALGTEDIALLKEQDVI